MSVPVITQQPQNSTIHPGEFAEFSVVATASPSPSYVWQQMTPGTTVWENVPSWTSATLRYGTTSIWESGTKFRCRVISDGDSTYSNEVTLTVEGPVNLIPLFPSGTQEADCKSIYISGNSGEAEGITYTVNSDGSITLDGTCTYTEGLSIYLYIIPNVSSLYAETIPRFWLSEGSYVLDLHAPSAGIYANIWAYNKSGGASPVISHERGENGPISFNFEGDTSTLTGEISLNFEFKGGTTFDNFTFRPMLEYGTVAHSFSSPLSSLNSYFITYQPQMVYADPGDTISFSVGASGLGLTFSWGSAYTDLTSEDFSGTDTDTLMVRVSESYNGYTFRCFIRDSNSHTMTSNTVKLKIRTGIEINSTNFPDPNFRNYVSTYLDKDNDGYLSSSEVESPIQMTIQNPVASLQGLEYFINLQELYVAFGGSALTINGHPKLKLIDTLVTDPDILESVSISNCPNLIEIHFTHHYNSIQTVTLRNCPLLKWVDLFANYNLSECTIIDCQSVVGINIQYAKIENFDLTNFPNLEFFEAAMCARLRQLDFSRCPKIKYIWVDQDNDGGSLTDCFVNLCENLRIIEVNGNPIASLILPDAQELHSVDISRTSIESLNIAKNSVLVDLVTTVEKTETSGYGTSYYRYTEDEAKWESDLVSKYSHVMWDRGSWPDFRSNLCFPLSTAIVNSDIEIITQPTDLVLTEQDEGGTLSLVAYGEDLTYLWEVLLADSNIWTGLLDANTDSYYVQNLPAYDLAKFRCCLRTLKSTVYSRIVTVTIQTTPVITQQPEDVTADEGTWIHFRVKTKSQPSLPQTYLWQQKEPEGEWQDVSMPPEGHTDIFSTRADLIISGYQFRCTITNNLGSVTTDEVTLTVNPDLRATSPSTISLVEGSSGTFNVNTKDLDESYQWQFSTDGVAWNDIRYATQQIYDFVAALVNNGTQYRCKVTIPGTDIYSSPSTLTVTADQSLAPPTIATQPFSLETPEGNDVTFSIEAAGSDLSYRWQTRRNGVWYNINGADSDSYTTLATMSLNNSVYRCQVSNAAGGVYSSTATLTVTSSGSSISTPTISTQPRSANVNDGQTAIFSLTANGGGLSYQWYIKRNGQWYPISGATNAIYSVVGRSANNGTQYRCLVTNSAGSVYSNVVDLNVQSSTPLSFYGYHSIIISGKNTYGEWEMYPTSRPHVAPPEVKTSYVDVPGADGGLDYTDLLTGEPRFGYRKGSWEFLLIPQERWPDVYRSLCNFLNGRVHTVVLEDDPTWQYRGRLSVNKWESAAHNSLITIDYILDPNPVNLDDESYSADDDDLAAAARILRKPGNEGMVIGMFSGSATVVDPATYFEDGDNISY